MNRSNSKVIKKLNPFIHLIKNNNIKTYTTTVHNNNNKYKNINDILNNKQNKPLNNISIRGWIRSIQNHKNVTFININDGSCLKNIQLVLNENNIKYKKELTIGSSIEVNGNIIINTKEIKEIQINNIIKIGECPIDLYPLQKKYQTLDYLRKIPHLRSRTNTFGAMTRIRNALSFGIHTYFQKENFFLIHTPIITSIDAEGAGEQFLIKYNNKTSNDNINNNNKNKIIQDKSDFFHKPTYLTVSGQLHGEIFATSLSKIYTFGPTFRAENSQTTRHLSEFWMVEPEIAFADLNENINIATKCIQYTINYALDTCPEDFYFFNKRYNTSLVDSLKYITEINSIDKITYTEAINILNRMNKGNITKWGQDLTRENEKYLVDVYFKKPIFVTDYPESIKPFYMKSNENNTNMNKTVACMDLLVPRVGELIGGSVRENRLNVLQNKLQKLNSDTINKLEWYLDLRRFGSVPHAGFGLGFDRLVQFATGIDNIKDVIPIPRYPGSCEF